MWKVHKTPKGTYYIRHPIRKEIHLEIKTYSDGVEDSTPFFLHENHANEVCEELNKKEIEE